jgi:hypothetical protein
VELGGGRDPQYEWLVSTKEDGAIKEGILTQLGRFKPRSKIPQYARLICKARCSTKEAITRLRGLRTGKESQGDTQKLANEIERTVRHYKLRYPCMSNQDIFAALASVLKQYYQKQKEWEKFLGR